MKQIGIDFQGWPVNALNLRVILKRLGFKDDGERIYIEKDNSLLSAYPRLLEDDGMGYGVNPQYITEADNLIYDIGLETEEYEVGEDQKLDITLIHKKETVPVFNFFMETAKEWDIRDEEGE